MSRPAKTALMPITLLTSFLGSGKTTLLDHRVCQPEMAAGPNEDRRSRLVFITQDIGQEIIEETSPAFRHVLPRMHETY